LDHGARIDQEALNLYDAKINALIIATESGSFACVKCLVENGLDVNYRIDGKVCDFSKKFRILTRIVLTE
jgi:hypothetical protein